LVPYTEVSVASTIGEYNGGAPGFNTSLGNITQRVEDMRANVAASVAADSGTGDRRITLDKFLEGSRYFVNQFYNFVAAIGTGSIVGQTADQLKAKHGVGDSMAGSAGNAATAAMNSLSMMASNLAVPNFFMGAAAGPALAADAGGQKGGVEFTLGGAGDAESGGEVSEEAKKAAMKGIRAKDYSPDEAKAILDAAARAVKAGKGSLEEVLSGLPSRGEDTDQWRAEFAKWYGEKVGGMNAADAARLVADKVGMAGGTVTLKRDKSLGGSDKGAVVTDADPAKTGLSPGDKVAFRDGKLYRLEDDGETLGEEVKLDAAVTPPTKDGDTFTAEVAKAPREEAEGKDDAASLIDYLKGDVETGAPAGDGAAGDEAADAAGDGGGGGAAVSGPAAIVKKGFKDADLDSGFAFAYDAGSKTVTITPKGGTEEGLRGLSGDFAGPFSSVDDAIRTLPPDVKVRYKGHEIDRTRPIGPQIKAIIVADGGGGTGGPAGGGGAGGPAGGGGTGGPAAGGGTGGPAAGGGTGGPAAGGGTGGPAAGGGGGPGVTSPYGTPVVSANMGGKNGMIYQRVDGSRIFVAEDGTTIDLGT
jgi:hypothetical protein